LVVLFFFSSRRRHTRFSRDWSSDVCSSDLLELRNVSVKEYDPLLEPVIVTYGEQFLTYIFSRFFQQEEINNTLLDAKKFMHISRSEERRVGKECSSRLLRCHEKIRRAPS